MNLPCCHEHGFEANALFANVTLRSLFGTLPNGTDGFQILIREPVFVAFDHDVIWINVESYIRTFSACGCIGVSIIIAILDKLEYKSGLASVQILCESAVQVSAID